MDDDQNLEDRAPSLPSRSDVDLISELSLMADAARARTGGLRERASSEATGDGAWIQEALQELDTAHEELRVAEEELHSQADELTASQTELAFERSRYRELFDAAPDPYLTTDAHGVILEANRRAVQLLGVPMIFILGKPLAIFVEPDLRTQFRHDLSAAVVEEVGLVSRFAMTLSAPRSATGRHRAPASRRVRASVGRGIGASRKSPELRWIFHEREPDRSAAPTEAHAIEPTRDAAVEQAVATSKLRDDLAREQRARLESELARRHSEELLALISQELRGPLRLIKHVLAPLEAAGTRGAVPHAHESTLPTRELQATASTLERLLGEISAGGGSLSLDRREIDLLELIHCVIARSEGIASFSGARIVAKLNRPLPVVQGDPARITQVLQTVLESALRLAPPDGVVEVTASADPRHVEISVRDGRPVQDEIAALPEQARAPAGLGIGLSLARHLTELHGGTLETESAGAGRSATLHIRLPHESRLAQAHAPNAS